MAFQFIRPVRFDEVDVAGFVYFARVVGLAHEAMEMFLHEKLYGGYAALVIGEGLGFPCVHVDVNFTAPLRFGDTMQVTSRVTKLGESSVTFDVRVARLVSGGVATACATICYIVAFSRFNPPGKVPLTDFLRSVLAVEAD